MFILFIFCHFRPISFYKTFFFIRHFFSKFLSGRIKYQLQNQRGENLFSIKKIRHKKNQSSKETCAYRQTHTHTLTHMQSISLTDTRAHTQTCLERHAQKHNYSNTHVQRSSQKHSYACTNTHREAQARTHAQIQKFTYPHIEDALKQAHVDKHINTQTHSCVHTYAQGPKFTRTNTQSYSQIYSYKRRHTQRQARTQKQSSIFPSTHAHKQPLKYVHKKTHAETRVHFSNQTQSHNEYHRQTEKPSLTHTLMPINSLTSAHTQTHRNVH